MASRRELQKLEDENRTLCHRLSDIEVELGRKEDALKAANLRYWIVAKYWQLVKSSKKWSQLVVATAACPTMKTHQMIVVYQLSDE